MLYFIGRNFFLILFRLTLVLKLEGLEHVPRTGACILASNHLSNLDPMLVGAPPRRRMNYLAKEALFKNPLAGWILRRVGAIPLKREGGDYGALRKALQYLKYGSGLILFPEGGRSVDGMLQEAKLGIGFIAAKSGVPVIPVAVIGSDCAMPRGSRFINRVKVTVRYGRPMVFGERVLNRKEHYQEIADRVMAAIAELRDKGVIARPEGPKQSQKMGLLRRPAASSQ